MIRLNNWLLSLRPLVPRTFGSDSFYDFICSNWILGFCLFAEDLKVHERVQLNVTERNIRRAENHSSVNHYCVMSVCCKIMLYVCYYRFLVQLSTGMKHCNKIILYVYLKNVINLTLNKIWTYTRMIFNSSYVCTYVQ